MTKIDHRHHNIITESEFILKIIKYIFVFPYLLSLYFRKQIDKKQLFYIYYEFGHFFKDAYITYTLIMLNLIAYIIEVFVLVPSGMIDNFIASPENTFSLNILSFITAPFLHSGLIHLFSNMLFLFIFGRVVEKYLGEIQLLIIYFSAGFLSQFIVTTIFMQSGVGASGAISGLVAAAILIRPFYLSYILIYPLPIFILGFLQIIGDFSGFFYPDPFSITSHIAHLVGYGSVSITAFMLNQEKRKEMKKGLFINLLFLIVFIFVNRLL